MIKTVFFCPATEATFYITLQGLRIRCCTRPFGTSKETVLHSYIPQAKCQDALNIKCISKFKCYNMPICIETTVPLI